ncbi:hypothetical protein PBAL39_16184 [Pedobacter sp. BAL39]|uniref:DUF2846 domain-containing protein n=1 Tax=Pedobacter sp. BAL39 TaxID=391596 RepID=UPI00015593C5|nr:DUF2846 domain-containing protein [Pedobacter sp. BAL39]EDM37980.1 hypothetical protein PBAL39_16184 [Pedobacter sp. BAL39]
MKALRLLLLFTVLLAGSFAAHSQTKTGKVYLIRLTGYTGSAVNYHFYVDGQLICKLKNKSYSVHDLSVGDHTVNISTGGISTGKKSAPLKITVVEGKANYINVISTESGYVNKVNCQEITQNSAEPLLAKAKEKTNCLAKK